VTNKATPSHKFCADLGTGKISMARAQGCPPTGQMTATQWLADWLEA